MVGSTPVVMAACTMACNSLYPFGMRLTLLGTSSHSVMYDDSVASHWTQPLKLPSWYTYRTPLCCALLNTNGLYLLLPSTNCTTKLPAHSYSCVTTIADNHAVFTHRELEGADRARQLYRTIRHPSQRKFETILDHGSILNCPVTKADTQRANIIYGPDLAYLKGKTTEHPASPPCGNTSSLTSSSGNC